MTAVELERASTAAPRPELDWERDWQGRPRILADPRWTVETAPPGWVVDGAVLESREYTRVTTHAEALQDASALSRWKMRRVVLGMSRRPDYVTAAAALTTEDRDRDALDDLAEKALEAAGPNAADVGTALHGFTERIDRGEDVGAVPEQYVATLDAYRRVVAHLTFLEYECRTVCDELEAAGTPDRIGLCNVPDPDGVVDELRIIDTKTGRVDYSAGKFSTQLAIYRRSKLYHPGTGARTSWEEKYGLPVSRWGLVVHIPAGAGVAELLWIELDHGDRGGDMAWGVRDWRKGATAARLLRPVFARPPRPRPTDGTCRGRKHDGTPCGYRRKSRADGLGAQFCGRHSDQAVDLERWLAENPDADPDGGQEELPSRSPVPSAAEPPPLTTQQLAPDMPAGSIAQEATADQWLVEGNTVQTPWPLPNGHLAADPGTLALDSTGRRWVKVQRADAYGWELVDHVLEDGGVELVRCRRTQLLVTQCACSVHRPELPTVMQEQLAAELADGYDAADTDGTDDPDPAPARELQLDNSPAVDAFVAEQSMHPLDGDDSYPDYGPDDDAAAAMGLPSRTVGTYALDPDTEVNGNPRPRSGLQEPADAALATDRARAALLAQIAAAQAESELWALYRRHPSLWGPEMNVAAAARVRELERQARTERPTAALLAALETAPDTGTLSRLFTQYGHTELWTAEAAALADNRWRQLGAMAQL